jgi:2-oxoglutarate ferredoxin oxidoreductase subunit alpha
MNSPAQAQGLTQDVTPVPRAASSVVLALVGSGGDGVVLLGDMLLRMAAEQGIYGLMVQSYGPQIRGGESAVVIRLTTAECHFEGETADALLCFRSRDLARFRGSVRLHEASEVILDAADLQELPEWLGRSSRPAYRHPFATFVNGVEMDGEPKNMMALAILAKALGWSRELARSTIETRFQARPAYRERNLSTFDKAWDAAADPPRLPRLRGHGRALEIESGNEAVARGAIDAGLQFFAGYPITPSSEIMETLIDELPAAGGHVVQAEDEIAALGMVVGASFGGRAAMTATSGPGLSLMTEMMGLSSMAEIPVVVVDCQRAGPATGMPSRTEQSDLFHAVYGGHGDFPRAVLGVFDVVHAHQIMYRAFQLAEEYQLPVTVLSDAYIAQRRTVRDPRSTPPRKPQRWIWTPEHGPARFRLDTEVVVSPFRVPGTLGGQYLASGIEHTPSGHPTADTTIHEQMNARRFRKIPALAAATGDWYRVLGHPDAPRGIIAWGSTYGLLQEWVAAHPDTRVFLPEILHPFPIAALEAWRKGLTWTAVVELSFQGQFHQYLRSLTDMSGVPSITRSGGVPLRPSELARLLAEAERSGR